MRKALVKKIALAMSLAMAITSAGPNMSVSAAKKKTISVKSVSIIKPSTSVLNMKKGSTYTIKYRIAPKNATNKKVKFATSNKKIVTVNSKGKITAISDGTAKVTVQAANNKKASITVKVGGKVKKVTLNTTSLTLTQGKTAKLKATVTPSTASNTKVSFVSSNKKVATVSASGTVTAKAPGTAIITAKALDGSKKSASCKVTVKAKPKPTVKPTAKPTAKPTVKPTAKPTVKPTTKPSVAPTGQPTSGPVVEPTSVPTTPAVPSELPGGYHLVWNDEFDGDELDMTSWNYEKHEPGWVNNELQRYTDSKENIYVEDGKLVIKANKDENEITSGKVTTAGKHDWKYGRFEISAKAVEGQGLWPAIWMMPREENFYGQWPRCGEIDIMEVLGHEPNKTYATIHYGNPHQEQQGSIVMEESLAKDFHVYALDWEPSYMRFYIDGILVKEVTDWFTKTEGKGEVTFPAPFDQYFHLQINQAVGGNWPGNPDETTNFDNAKFMIDYVRVYQKDFYDENVKKPEKEEVILRDPDATGNYIKNGTFAVDEELNDDEDWGVKYASTGKGEVSIDTENNQMVIKTEDEGKLDYAVQIVQPNLPMKKGGVYKVSFYAKAEEARTMITNVTAPDRSYVRYLADQKIELGTDFKLYEFTFHMEGDDDANGRLEFNLGNQNSKATVFVKDVRVEKIGEKEIAPPEKVMLPDGNYVYNGEFQEGENRLDYWTVDCTDATYGVTNVDGIREFKVEGKKSTMALDDVLLKQDVAINPNKVYAFSFQGYTEEGTKTIEVRVAGQTFEFELTKEKKEYKIIITTDEEVSNKELVFALGNPGVIYIDDVRLADDGLLINGDFTSDLKGWTPFVDGGIASDVTYTVDTQKVESKAAAFEIANTGDADWKIQLMQENIRMEKGKWYEISFIAKTDLAGGRQLKYAIQHNGSSDDNWTEYLGAKVVNLTNEFQKFTAKFQMREETDLAARLSFSMGAINGKVITDTHNIYIDNVTLEETEPGIVEGNMITNAEFIQDENGNFAPWEAVTDGVGAATYKTEDKALHVNITSVGNADYGVQLKQPIGTLVNGHKYQLKMTVKSSVDRTVKVALMDTTYDWYGGKDIVLKANEEAVVDETITVDKATNTNMSFFVSMGKIENEDTQPGEIVISNLSLEEVE